jgi:type II secretion system protein E
MFQDAKLPSMRLSKVQSLKLGQLLIQKGLLTVEQLDTALVEQKKTKALLGEILIKSGFLSDETLYGALSEQAEVEYVKLKNRQISPELISKIPFKLAVHYKMIPIAADATSLTVATSSPISIHTLDDLTLVLNKTVKVVVASAKDVNDAIRKHYGVGAETMDRIVPSASAASTSIQAQETQNIGDSAEDASIVKFVNQILVEAYKEKASDIHIEPFENRVSVRYRVDGVLYDTKVPMTIRNFHAAIVSRVKIMANLNISETRLPQDGRIRVHIEEAEVDLRVSLLPTPYGESLVIRLLSTNTSYGIEKLGLLTRDLKTLELMLRKPHGIIFVTGPTGSGKTTTLYSCLNKINTPEKKIITIEDPIEYRMQGITQVQVHPKIDLTFSQALRSILRHDPDVIMVGEVRDYETAEITIRVALTGHLIFSTLHTNDSATAVTRLVDMGIEPFLVTSSVQCFIAQRLVRLICPDCKKQAVFSDETLKEFEKEKEDLSDHKFFEGAGCESCKFTGYQGRAAIYEILPVRSQIKELILQRASAEKIKAQAIGLGMRTLRQDGWEKIVLGWTTPMEVLRVTQTEESAELS